MNAVNKVFLGAVWAVVTAAVSIAAEESTVRTNAGMRVEWDRTNGGLSSLTLTDDAKQMNWIEGAGTWGTIRSFRTMTDRTPQRHAPGSCR